MYDHDVTFYPFTLETTLLPTWCVCSNHCVCVKSLVSLVLGGDRKCTTTRAQVPYLFLESVCICVSLIYPKGSASGFRHAHTHTHT